jgi:uncharacterized membrane protein YsdA (DUF1294 family)
VAGTVGTTHDLAASTSTAAGVSFFALFWIILIVGFLIHWLVDRHRHGHHPRRVIELGLLWVVAFGGLWTLLGGISHISGQSHHLATSIGYAPSMFQWEVGWADIAVGFLGLACVRKSLRGQWMTAAVVVLAIYFAGDGIGHIMQWSAHHNTAPDNIWAIPSDFLQPAVGIILLMLYRRSGTPAPAAERELSSAGAGPR